MDSDNGGKFFGSSEHGECHGEDDDKSKVFGDIDVSVITEGVDLFLLEDLGVSSFVVE